MNQIDKNFIKYDQCVVCSYENYKIDFPTDPFGNRMNVGRCLNCGHLQAHNYFSNAGLASFYSSNTYREMFDHPNGKNGAFDKQLQRGQRIYESFKSSFKDKPEVLEIGCGLGAIGKVFIENKHDYIGVDLNDEYLSYGRREIPGVDLRVINDFGDLLHFEKKFDLIVLSHVVEHLTNPKELLGIVESHLLKDTGLIYVEVPSVARAIWDKKELEDFIELPHFSYFTLFSLNNLMLSSGFRSVKRSHNLCCLFEKHEDCLEVEQKRSLRHSSLLISLNNFLNVCPSMVKQAFKNIIRVYFYIINVVI